MAVPNRTTDPAVLATLIEGEPAVGSVLAAAADQTVYLVGGSVRDALLGLSGPGPDLDLALDGPVADVARGLDPNALLHERFDTAELEIDGRSVDIARTRTEQYPHPGALPVVAPARIEDDLQRRDFTINALAVKVEDPGTLIDPRDGRSDLERGLLRVLHDESFVDDPTRALRAARYCARLGFDLELKTAELVRATELHRVSRERVDNELALIADEPTALEALRLASAWGLLDIPEERLELTASALELIAQPAWGKFSDRRAVVQAALRGPGPDDVADLVAYPGTASLAVAAATGRSELELVIARAIGAEWLDLWLHEWRGVEPEVTGDDLLRAGIPAGPAIGVGLNAALEARLDSGLRGREAQVARAVAAARRSLRGSPQS